MHLSYDNFEGFLLAFIPAIINISLLGFILFELPKNKITGLFALVAMSMTLWQINDALARIIQDSKLADNVDSFLAFTWIFLPALSLHFTFLYTGLWQRRSCRTLAQGLYIIAFVFTSLYQGHVYPHVFQYDRFWGWINSYNNSVLDTMMVLWMSLCVMVSSIILAVHSYKIKHNNIWKKQAQLIAVGFVIPTIAGFISQFVFPVMLNRMAIPLTSTFMSFFSIATVLAFRKYKLFSVNELVRTEAVLESMPLVIFSVNAYKKITYINKQCLELLHLDPSEMGILKLKGVSAISKASTLSLEEMLFKTLDGEVVPNVEMLLYTEHGEVVILFTSTPIVNNNNIEGVLFIGRDITKLKKSYTLLEKKEELLKEAQKLSKTGSWEWNLRTDKVIWSDQLYEIYDLQPGKMELSFDNFLTLVEDPYVPLIREVIYKSISSGEPFEYFYRLKSKSRKDLILHAKGCVSVDENNDLLMNGTVQDVTQMKNNESKLQQQNQQLKKINLELDKFVYSVSHDLRAPLTSVQGLLALAERESAEPKLLNYLKMCVGNIKKLDSFILEILDYSRNSRTSVENENILFSPLINDIIDNLRFAVGGDDQMKFIVNTGSDIAFKNDSKRLGIILNNLISNSIRYRNTEEPDPFVQIDVTVTPDRATIIIADNGIGIRKELQHKVFDMFYRGTKHSVGSGLGLYIAKEAAEKMGGEISLKSEHMKGATFTVVIPNRNITFDKDVLADLKVNQAELPLN